MTPPQGQLHPIDVLEEVVLHALQLVHLALDNLPADGCSVAVGSGNRGDGGDLLEDDCQLLGGV